MDKEEIRQRSDIVAVASTYTKLTKRGHEYVGLCPFHSEKTPSFSVNEQRGICTCFGGCGTFDVFSLVQKMECVDFVSAKDRVAGMIGMERPPDAAERLKRRKPTRARVTSDPPPDAPPPDFGKHPLGTPQAIYPICRLDGFVIGYEVRYVDEDGKKQPRIWTWDGKKWGLGQFSGARPLYGLHTLHDRPKAPVFVSEGPKKAEAISVLLPMYASVSLLNGCGSILKHDWTPLAGRTIIVWPDADMPGRKAGLQIAQMLSDPRGFNCPVRMIHPNDKTDGWDAADAFSEGWTTEETIEWCKLHLSDFIRAEDE